VFISLVCFFGVFLWCVSCVSCVSFVSFDRWLIVAAYIISADGLTLNNIKSSGALNYNSPFGKTTTGKMHHN
jgi:hypothetical protein